MIILHVKIIAFQASLWIFYIAKKTVIYIINSALTREISCSAQIINLVFPNTHVLFSFSTDDNLSSLLFFL